MFVKGIGTNPPPAIFAILFSLPGDGSSSNRAISSHCRIYFAPMFKPGNSRAFRTLHNPPVQSIVIITGNVLQEQKKEGEKQ